MGQFQAIQELLHILVLSAKLAIHTQFKANNAEKSLKFVRVPLKRESDVNI